MILSQRILYVYIDNYMIYRYACVLYIYNMVGFKRVFHDATRVLRPLKKPIICKPLAVQRLSQVGLHTLFF